jgi:hypothetical protein
MTISNHVVRWGGARLSRRLSRSLPWVGTAIALLTVASTMRKKGLIRGVLDTGLNAVPGVGAAKNVVEVVRGRDFFPDRVPTAQNQTRAGSPSSAPTGSP